LRFPYPIALTQTPRDGDYEASVVPFLQRLRSADLARLGGSPESAVLAGEPVDGGGSNAMRRLVMRLPAEDRHTLDRLRARLWDESRIDVSRADVMRFFVWCGLSVIDPARPLVEQLPVRVLRRGGVPSARPWSAACRP